MASARGVWVSAVIAVCLALVALLLAAARLLQPTPEQINIRADQAQISLSTSNARVAFDLSCMSAYWRVSGAHSIAMNDSPVSASGTQTVCGAPPRLDVVFADNSTQEFTLPREIIFTPEYRLLILCALGLIALLLWSATRQTRSSNLRIVNSNFGFAQLARDAQKFVTSETPLYQFALIVITSVGIAARLAFISMPIGLDEAVTFVRYASVPLAQGLSDYSLPNNHLFHTLLVHISTTLLGIAPWTLRLPALMAGVLTIPAAYGAGRALYNRHAGLIAAAICAASWPLIEYSTNARGYTLICLFFLLLIVLAVYLRRRRNPAGWMLFALLTALGFYTIPTMLYPIGIIGLWLGLTILIENRGRQRWLLIRDLALATLAAGVLTVILYLPPILRSGLHAVIANQWVAPLTWAKFTSGLLGFLEGVGNSWLGSLPTLLIEILGIGFVLGAIFYWRSKRQRVPLIGIALLWMAFLLAVQKVLPFTRVLLFLLPLAAIVAGAGLVWLIGWLPRAPRAALVTLGALALAVWLGSISLKTGSAPPGDADMLPMATYLQTQLRPGDSILLVLVRPNLEFYFRALDYNDDYFHTGSNLRRIILIVNRSVGQTPNFVLYYYQARLSQYDMPRILASFGQFDIYVSDYIRPTLTNIRENRTRPG